jgi:hypothetical protein
METPSNHHNLGRATMTENNTDDEQDVPRTHLGILGTFAEPTGTGGFPVLSHQFAPSSLIHQENCLKSSKTFWLKRNKLKKALLL